MSTAHTHPVEASEPAEGRAPLTSTGLDALRDLASSTTTGTVTIDASVMLALLSHINELHLDLHNIDEFIEDAELEEEGYSPAIRAWNRIVDQFRDVPRLSCPIDVVDIPVIERLDLAEARITDVRRLAQGAINRYNHHTMIRAKTVVELLDGARPSP